MKINLRQKFRSIHNKMQAKDKLYGTTTIGARGQVVIPAEARKELNLKPGDQLMVMGKFGKVLGMIKAEEMSRFVETIMENLSGTGVEEHAKKHFQKFFGPFLKTKNR